MIKASYHKIAIYFFCTTLLSSCATHRTKRIEENKNKFLSYSIEQQKLITKGEIDLGFTKFQVYLALGDPYSKIEFGEKDKVTAKYLREKWGYLSSKSESYDILLSKYEYQGRCYDALSNYVRNNEWLVRERASTNHNIERRFRVYQEEMRLQCNTNYTGSFVSSPDGLRSFSKPSRYITETVTRFSVYKYLFFFEDKFTHLEILSDPIFRYEQRTR